MLKYLNPLPKFLIERYKVWKVKSFNKKKALHKKLAINGQNPKAMIISCCDSRVHVSSIFNADIGEFFIHRNIANIVPKFNIKDNYGTYASIEYAVKVLKVPHIIILGHSKCGGIDYAYKYLKNKKNNYIFIDAWLRTLKSSYKSIPKNISKSEKLNFFEKESIKDSILNLTDFPIIKKLIKKNKLQLHGLWYDIESGTLMYLDSNSNSFKKIT